jgi:ubiquinone/menaquinone biosynthesis C-methylase UbiE
MPDYPRIYAGQELMTPGAARTVQIIVETVSPADGAWLVDVASGKGEAAVTLARQLGCRVVCIERNNQFLAYTKEKVARLHLDDRVLQVQADGQRLPLRDGTMRAASCIGAPSIVGLRSALQEMTRVLDCGGSVIASDIVWRRRPGPLGEEWGWVAHADQITTNQYVAALASAGLVVDRVETHDRAAWNEYWNSIMGNADRERTTQGEIDPSFVGDIQHRIAVERRAVDAWLEYATFVASKP